MNPVTLVITVVSRKSAVHAGRPVTIAMRLITTCRSVKVSSDMPRIMTLPSPGIVELRCRAGKDQSTFRRSAPRYLFRPADSLVRYGLGLDIGLTSLVLRMERVEGKFEIIFC